MYIEKLKKYAEGKKFNRDPIAAGAQFNILKYRILDLRLHSSADCPKEARELADLVAEIVSYTQNPEESWRRLEEAESMVLTIEWYANLEEDMVKFEHDTAEFLAAGAEFGGSDTTFATDVAVLLGLMDERNWLYRIFDSE